MQWIAPSEKDASTTTLEKRLWQTADQFRANSGLTAAQYSQPVLGLIFLRFAEVRFSAAHAILAEKAASANKSSRRGSQLDDPSAYHAQSVLYLTPTARFDHLLAPPNPPTSAKLSTTPCATSKSTTPPSPASSPKPTTSSPGRRLS
jgi:type I restriction enzyme M protein